MFSWPSDSIVHRFCKLGFFSVSFNATLTLVGQLCKTLLHASLGGVPISTLAIHTCRSQRYAILLLCFVFLSRTKSDQVSVNNIFMRLAIRHNSKTIGRINDTSTLLISWHDITSRGPSSSCFHGPVTPLCIGFVN